MSGDVVTTCAMVMELIHHDSTHCVGWGILSLEGQYKDSFIL